MVLVLLGVGVALYWGSSLFVAHEVAFRLATYIPLGGAAVASVVYFARKRTTT